MVTKSITERIDADLGHPKGTSAKYTNSTLSYDMAIGGLPFFMAASDKYPYSRETALWRKQQIDLTQQPGEQTFQGWWIRSQSSFHLGAGIKYLEPLQGDNMIYRFDTSNGVDVWTPGYVTLLSDTTKVFGLSDNVDMFGCIDGANASCVFVSDDVVLTRIATDGTTSTVSWGGSVNPITSITQDGTNYYAANATGIYKGTLTGGAGSKVWNTGSANTTIAWVKQRLFAGIGTGLYELAGGTPPTLPTAVYTHPNANWQWTSIVEGPTAIYAAGYAGTSSSIYKIGLSDSGGSVPLINGAVTAADFPDDEHVTSLGVYLGKYMLIGTNKGVRVGIIDSNGYISYGGLTYTQDSTSHVSGFAFKDRFAYATVTNDIDGKSGLIRIDLSQEVESGRYAWANDLSAGVSGDCRNVAFIGETGLLAFTVAGNGVYFQHATNKVASGYIQTGATRFNTLEKKHYKLVTARLVEPITGSVNASYVTKGGNVVSMITLGNETGADFEFTTSLEYPQEQLALRFTLNRDATDLTTGGGLNGYQLKALPANKRNRSMKIPLMCYDFEMDRFNVQVGHEGSAFERLSALENVESLGDVVTIQDFTSGEQVSAVIEGVTFQRMSPPERGFSGFGGVVYVQVRTV